MASTLPPPAPGVWRSHRMTTLTNDPLLRKAESPLRIFLVEDHPEEQKFLILYLETCGHRVSAAFDIAHAVQRLAALPYDALVCDIGLPDGDGWELMSTVKLFQPLYAIAITGRAGADDAARSKEAGFHRHLRKPLVLSELDAALAEAAAHG